MQLSSTGNSVIDIEEASAIIVRRIVLGTDTSVFSSRIVMWNRDSSFVFSVILGLRWYGIVLSYVVNRFQMTCLRDNCYGKIYIQRFFKRRWKMESLQKVVVG